MTNTGERWKTLDDSEYPELMDTTTASPTATIPRLPSVASMLSGIVAAAFVGSIIFDWGFFSALGIWFDDVPTTLADHTRTALIWMPPFLLSLVIVIFLHTLKGPSPPEPPAAKKGFLGWLGDDAPYALIYVVLIAAVVLHGEAAHTALGTLLTVLWFRIAFPWARKRNMFATLGWLTTGALIFAPAVGLMAFYNGWQSGIARGWQNSQTAVVQQGEASAHTVRAVRPFERGLLYRDGGDLHFARWEDVRDLSSEMRPARFGYWCRLRDCDDGRSPFVDPPPS